MKLFYCSSTSPGKPTTDSEKRKASPVNPKTNPKRKQKSSVESKKKGNKKPTNKKPTNKKPLEQSVEELASKAKVKNAKQLTLLFNKLRTKIGILEPITPTWYWTCIVEKNTENAR